MANWEPLLSIYNTEAYARRILMEQFYRYLEDKNIYLNDKQKKVVTWDKDQLLVLACPGSGKTTVLNARVAYMIKEMNVNPRNILALTFSRAAAREMDSRFNKIYDDISKEGLSFSTIHSFCFKLLRSYYRKTNVNYELIEGGGTRIDKRHLLKKIYLEANHRSINDDKLEDLLSSISNIKNAFNQEIDFSSYNIPKLETIYRAYEDFKRNNEYNQLFLDFDDLLLEGYRLLSSNKYYRDNCRSYYKHVLIDEGQDTSLIQNKIIEVICENHKKLMVVCDDDQSIYRFRGADPEYLLKFKGRYKTGDILNLDINYRSTQNIVKTARKFIQHNRQRYDKEIHTNNKDGDRVKIVNIKDPKDQIDYIIDTIKLDNRIETAILYRNNISAIELANHLVSKGIPFYIRDYHKGFFNHWILNDILNVMRFANNDHSINLLESIYNKIDTYVSKVEIAYIKELKSEMSVFEKLITHPDMKDFKKRNMKELKKIFESFKEMDPLSIIRFIRNQLGYDNRLKKYSETAGYSYENLKLILNALEDIANGAKGMQEFVNNLNNLKLYMYESRKNVDATITLSTMHSSKGLEFDRVIMYDLFDEIIPTKDSISKVEQGDFRDIEEDRRLWYVGMTRARYDLRLLKVKSGIYDKSHSRFFNDLLDTNSIEIVDRVKTKAVGVGNSVMHKVFGTGRIESLGEDTIVILFNNHGRKTLSLSLCVDRNLIDVN